MLDFLVRVYCILSSQFHLVSDPLTLLGLSQSPDGYAVIEQGRLLNGAEQVMGSLPPSLPGVLCSPVPESFKLKPERW